jgi:methylated-DNA-[protein]-cysteine S-methyltransferase
MTTAHVTPTHPPVRLAIDHLDTPIGRFAIVVDALGRLRAAGFTDGHRRMEKGLEHSVASFGTTPEPTRDPAGLTSALRRYFDGELSAIDGLPVAGDGTPFQKRVWAALLEIPCGETRSYADIARRIGKPAAVRAVGLANGSNPIGVIVPCHRVIGSDGSLTGYGGGIERKKWLLAHEGRQVTLAVGAR